MINCECVPDALITINKGRYPKPKTLMGLRFQDADATHETIDKIDRYYNQLGSHLCMYHDEFVPQIEIILSLHQAKRDRVEGVKRQAESMIGRSSLESPSVDTLTGVVEVFNGWIKWFEKLPTKFTTLDQLRQIPIDHLAMSENIPLLGRIALMTVGEYLTVLAVADQRKPLAFNCFNRQEDHDGRFDFNLMRKLCDFADKQKLKIIRREGSNTDIVFAPENCDLAVKFAFVTWLPDQVIDLTICPKKVTFDYYRGKLLGYDQVDLVYFAKIEHRFELTPQLIKELDRRLDGFNRPLTDLQAILNVSILPVPRWFDNV
jgi:hypothetical protein